MRFQLIFLCFASAAMASPLAQIPDSDPTLFDPESTDSGLVVAQVPVLNEPTSQEPGNEYSETNPDSVNYINPGVYTQALCCDISKSTGGMKLPCSAYDRSQIECQYTPYLCPDKIITDVSNQCVVDTFGDGM